MGGPSSEKRTGRRRLEPLRQDQVLSWEVGDGEQRGVDTEVGQE